MKCPDTDARKRREDPKRKKLRDMAKRYRRTQRRELEHVEWSEQRHKTRTMLQNLKRVGVVEIEEMGEVVMRLAEGKKKDEKS